MTTSPHTGKLLEQQIQYFCDHQKRIICKGLSRRPIFLDQYIVCTRERRDKTKRMQFFFCAVELLKQVKSDDISSNKIIDGKQCFECTGISRCGQEFGVHIREETIQKDRKLYLISTFGVQKKA